MKRAVLCCLLAFLGCTEEGPTTPEPLPEIPTAAPVASSSEPAPLLPELPDMTVSINSRGHILVNNHPNLAVTLDACFFRMGPHPQQLLETRRFTVNGGRNANISPPALCDRVQIDVGKKRRMDCSNPSNALGEVLKWAIVDFEPCECIPGEWVEVPSSRITARTVWGPECPPGPRPELTECSECRRIRSSWTETNGCEERNRNSVAWELRERIPCPLEN